MPPLIFYAVILFTIAFLFYTIGVWSEHCSKQLKNWHVACFVLGIISDAAATELMIENIGYIKLTAHTISGFIGFFLMLFHSLWASFIRLKKNEHLIRNFHKFSVVVWYIWMVSYLSGIALGVQLFG
jgi:uncharacterized repeat protein (TIGR03987 family)